PQDETPNDGRRVAVRRNRVHLAVRAVLAQSWSQNEDARQRGPSANAGDDGRTGEVPEAGGREPSSAPDPMTGDRIYERHQQEREDNEGDVLDSFRDRSRNDRRCRPGEHKLE